MFAKLQVALRALTCRPSMRADDQCQAEAGVQKGHKSFCAKGQPIAFLASVPTLVSV